jgi:hypothetical protein
LTYSAPPSVERAEGFEVAVRLRLATLHGQQCPGDRIGDIADRFEDIADRVSVDIF